MSKTIKNVSDKYATTINRFVADLIKTPQHSLAISTGRCGRTVMNQPTIYNTYNPLLSHGHKITLDIATIANISHVQEVV